MEFTTQGISDGTNTISCVICDLNEEVFRFRPRCHKIRSSKTTWLTTTSSIRIGWGADWEMEDKKWVFTQSSGVLSLHGQLPYFGKCPKVAMCGMMSPRETPYSSIEAGVEVSRLLSHRCFGTRRPLKPLLLTQVGITYLSYTYSFSFSIP